MTPTGRNRLMEIFLSGTKSAMKGQEPEQTGYVLPLARYEGGGVAPAVPGMLTDLSDAMNRGMSQNLSDFNSPSPEVRDNFDRNALIDAFSIGGAAATGSMIAPRPLGSLGAGGMPRTLRPANDSTVGGVATGGMDNTPAMSPMPWGTRPANNINAVPDRRPSVDEFLSAGVQRSKSGAIGADELYSRFLNWSRNANRAPLSPEDFARQMNDSGIQKAKIGGRVRYLGLEE